MVYNSNILNKLFVVLGDDDLVDPDMNTARAGRIALFAGLLLDKRRPFLASTERIAASSFWRHAKIFGSAQQRSTASGEWQSSEANRVRVFTPYPVSRHVACPIG